MGLSSKLTLDVRVSGGSADRIAWGDWGEAVRLELEYANPRTGKPRRSAKPSDRSSAALPFLPSWAVVHTLVTLTR
jgi:hypothetical protein